MTYYLSDMSTVKKIAKNSGSLLLGTIATKIISFFIVIYTARYLGDVGYGKYSFAIAFVSFFYIIPYLGIQEILTREIARNPKIAEKAIGNATLIQSILGILALALAFLIGSLMSYPLETVKAIYLAALGLLFSGLSPFRVIYQVNFTMKYTVLFGVLSRIFLLASVLIITSADYGLSWLIVAGVLADALHSILMAFFSNRFVKPEFKIDPALCRFLLKEAIPIALTSVFITIYFRIDVVMLSIMKGDAAAGIYSAGTRLTESLLFLSSTFMVSMFPIMSMYSRESPETLAFAYQKSIKYLFIFALPMAVGVTLLSDKIILIVYGEQFMGTSTVLKILIWATAILFITNVTNFLLMSTNKQKFITFSTALCALLNIVLNLILIPIYSYQGAAFATVFTELCLSAMLIYRLPSSISNRITLNEFHAPVIAAVTMSIFILFSSTIFSTILIIIPSILIYFITLYLFGGVNKEDKKLISKLIKFD